MANTHPTPRGIPILSGPPPVVESQACRQCARDFNVIFRRGKACGHCGYEYCSACMSDGQALMPRRTVPRASGPLAELREAFRGVEPTTSGYDPEPVCVHCLAMLQVTAAPLDMLRSLPLKRLKEYLTAYNIPIVGIKEKEGLVEAVVKARNPSTGTLRPENESFYRRRSVPRNGRPADARRPSQPQSSPHQARPPPPGYTRPPPPNYNQRPQPEPARQAPSRPRPAPQAQTQPARSQPPSARPTPPPPVPSILSLVALPKSYLSSLSIGTLKAILYENHVRVDFKQVLEKEELINRVAELVTDERKRLERQRREEEREAAEAAAGAARPIPSPQEESRVGEGSEGGENGETTTEPKPTPSPPTGPAPDIDRGLCVVCQDEEATLAVVDCGHLAMCSHCSDLIMATSKECPLCRTRIVTPQRLIRIYRV